MKGIFSENLSNDTYLIKNVVAWYVPVEKQDLWSAEAVTALAAPQTPCWQAAETFSPPAATRTLWKKIK